MTQESASGDAIDPRLHRLQEVARLVRVDVGTETDVSAVDKRVKSTIDAIVSPLSDNRKKLIELMRDPAKPMDEEVLQWARNEVSSSLDQVQQGLASLPEIQELEHDFIEREFASQGFDLSRADEIINTMNNDGKMIGKFPVRRDIRARGMFRGHLRHIAFLLRSIRDGSMTDERARPEIEQYAEALRNLLSKKFVYKQEDPETGWLD